MTPDARTRTPSSPQPRSTGISPFLGNPPQHDRLLTQFYRRSSRRRGVGRAGVPADRSFPAAASFPSRASSIRGPALLPPHWSPTRMARQQRPRRAELGATATPPSTTVQLRRPGGQGSTTSTSTLRATPQRLWGPSAGGAGGAWSRPSAGRGGPGASRREEVPAPGFGEVLPRRLRTAPPRPLPDCRAGPWSARAGGGASGSGARLVSARAPRRGQRPCPSRPGPGDRAGRELREPAHGTRTPRTPAARSTWTLGRSGTGARPPRLGEGALQPGSPFCGAQSLGK